MALGTSLSRFTTLVRGYMSRRSKSLERLEQEERGRVLELWGFAIELVSRDQLPGVVLRGGMVLNEGYQTKGVKVSRNEGRMGEY